ncbi:MAG: integrase core domain-containing protein [Acidimicrobiales bacterium]
MGESPTGCRKGRRSGRPLWRRVWVHTVRQELLDRTLIWNQRQLHRLLQEFIEHYNQHRPHRSLNQRAPNDGADRPAIEPAIPIHRSTTCAGLINEYRPAA